MFIWTKEVTKRVLTFTFKVDLESSWGYSGDILSEACFLLSDAAGILVHCSKSPEAGRRVPRTHLRLLPNLPGQVQRSVKMGLGQGARGRQWAEKSGLRAAAQIRAVQIDDFVVGITNAVHVSRSRRVTGGESHPCG